MNDLFQQTRALEELARWAPTSPIRTAPPASFRDFRDAAIIHLEQIRYRVLALPCPETKTGDSHPGQWEILEMIDILESKMNEV